MNISKERLEKALCRLVYNFTEIEGHTDNVAMDVCDFTRDEFNYIRSLIDYDKEGFSEQFFRPIMWCNRKTIVYNRNYIIRKKEYRSPENLIEHALIGDKFVNSICEKIYNSHKPARLTWLGDFSHRFADKLTEEFNGFSPARIKYFRLKYWNKNTYTTSVVASDFSIIDKYIVKDTSIMNLLVSNRDRIKKSLNNVMAAVEQGIVTSTTKQRIEELEQELDVAESKILIEENKNNLALTRNDVKKFFFKCLKKEPRLMIRAFIKEIIVYNDKIEIYYNYIDAKRPDDLEHQAFSFYTETMIIDPKDFNIGGNGSYIFELTINLYL